MSKIITVLDHNKKPFRLLAKDCRDWAFRATRADVAHAIRQRQAGAYATLHITKYNQKKTAAHLVDYTGVTVYLIGRKLEFGCHRFGVRASATIMKWALRSEKRT